MSSHGKERLLARWSRLKRESTARPDEEITATHDEVAGTAPDQAGKPDEKRSSEHPGAPKPELPAIDELTPESDFRAFMDPGVDDNVRRAALKTLFRNPDFNVTDGLDVYAEDYTKLEKLTPAMVAALKYAQRTLFSEREPADDRHQHSRQASIEEPAIPEHRAADGPAAPKRHDIAATDVPAADRDAAAQQQTAEPQQTPGDATVAQATSYALQTPKHGHRNKAGD